MTARLPTPKGDELEGIDGFTSRAKLGDTGEQTGFWLEELAAPYYDGLLITGQNPGSSEEAARALLEQRS